MQFALGERGKREGEEKQKEVKDTHVFLLGKDDANS
jgi:hypothetical protein